MTPARDESDVPPQPVEQWERPLPRPDNVSKPFWEAASRGELLIQRCPSGHRQFYPRAVCRVCGDDPGWEQASGRGTVHTYTVIRQNHARPFRDELPYVVAMVDLVEGVRMMGNITGCAPDEVYIGMPVEVRMVQAEPDVGVPFWRPVAGGPGTKGATA
ncbi:MAG TPA: Zn-ribbon domain-containing OB-fold protein [Acidimicrobiales bacterium]